MNEVRIDERSPRHVQARQGGAGFARSAADRLGLAAAPVFAIMALWTARYGSAADPLCSAMHDASLPGGMTAMYVLMSVFHLPPWLKFVSRRRAHSPTAAD